MEFLNSNTRRADPGQVLVTGATLSEAFKNVRKRFGRDAVITGTRTRRQSRDGGWGTEEVVEVAVAVGDGSGEETHGIEQAHEGLTAEIRYEVERLERMVEDIIQPQAEKVAPAAAPDYPLAEFLVQGGASPGAVDRLLTRFAGETGLDKSDRPGAISWLEKNLAVGPGNLEQWRGTHAFLGEHSTDRLDLVLQLATVMKQAGRSVLVVAVLPDPDRDLTRLQNRAETAGFDAAVVREVAQFDNLESGLEGYELVLVDLPSLSDPAMTEDGALPRFLKAKTTIQRHLRLPLDRDFQDLDDLRDAARLWGCDWLALDRLGSTRHAAKILDLIETIPLPVSLLTDDASVGRYLAAATVELLLDRLFTPETGPRFTPGLKAENA